MKKYVNGEVVMMNPEEIAEMEAIFSSNIVTEQEVREEGARRMREAVSGYSDEERETWMQQIEEANNGGGPLVNALAQSRGLTVQQMCAVIINKRDIYLNDLARILAAQSALIAMDPIPQDYADDSYWSN